MKTQTKILLSVAVICSFLIPALSASAQVSFGARAGVNLSTQPTPEYYHEVLALPYVGVFAQYQLSPPFAIQLGASYSGEGVKLKDLSTGDMYTSKLSYINVPLLAQYKFAFGGYIELGPQIGFLLSAKDSGTGIPSTDVKAFYKSTDLSGIFGIGYELKNGLGLNIRYSRSLPDVNKESDGISADNIYNRVLSIGLTYRLQEKK